MAGDTPPTGVALTGLRLIVEPELGAAIPLKSSRVGSTPLTGSLKVTM